MSRRPKTPQILDIVARTDANLSSYAHDAGKRAHNRGLEKRGAVMKTQDGMLVIEHRDGATQVLREMPMPQPIRAGTVLKRRSTKGESL
jgi:hypothetical protein